MKNGVDCLARWEPRLPGELHPSDRRARVRVIELRYGDGRAFPLRSEVGRFATPEEASAAIQTIVVDEWTRHEVETLRY